MMSEPYHIPVMVSEIVDFLHVVENGLYVDCTLGGGGHSRAILERGGSVIGIDKDREAIAYARESLSHYGDRFRTQVARFSGIGEIVNVYAGMIDGVIMDLGLSSRMIDDPSK